MGTTTEKLNYLNDTKNQLKDLINKLGGNLTDNSTFRSYVDEICYIYPKTTVTGTSISVSDTIAYDIKNFMLNSNTLTQDGTPSPSSPVDVNVIKGNNNIKIANSDDSKNQNYNINLGTLEYCKIGDYADQIFKNTTDSPYYDSTLVDGDWYIKKNVQKTVIDKNIISNFSYNTSYSVPALLVAKSNFGRGSGWGNGYTLTNQYKEITSSSAVVSGSFASNFSQAYLTFFNSAFTSSQTALDILDGTIVYIVKTTPTYIHITEEDYPILQPQLENIYNNAKSYNNTTNITQANDDLPFNLSVDVLKKGNE